MRARCPPSATSRNTASTASAARSSLARMPRTSGAGNSRQARALSRRTAAISSWADTAARLSGLILLQIWTTSSLTCSSQTCGVVGLRRRGDGEGEAAARSSFGGSPDDASPRRATSRVGGVAAVPDSRGGTRRFSAAATP